MRRTVLLVALCAVTILAVASASSAGGTHRLWKPPATQWEASPLASGNYVSVCTTANPDRAGTCYAARADNGIDWITWSAGAWTAQPVVTGTKYVDIAGTEGASGFMVGVRQDGGIDWINWGGSSWTASPLINGNYVAICPKSVNADSGYYAARADDGVDWIYWAGDHWAASPLIRGVTYTDIAADARPNGYFYGCNADGVDWVSWDGSAWVTSRLASGSYSSVAIDTSAVPGDGLFAAKASSGIDRLTWDGSAFVATQVLAGSFSDICDDATGKGYIFGAAASNGQVSKIWLPTLGLLGSVLDMGDHISVCPSTSTLGSCYVARADTGIDWISWYGGGWTVTNLISGTKYVDLCEQWGITNGFMAGVREDGGVDWINWFGGWTASHLINGNYVAICPKSSGPNDGYYGARADDGVDWICWAGGWIASPVIRGAKYTDLAPDSRGNGFFFGCNANGVDWLAWSGTWSRNHLVDGNYVSVAADTANPGLVYAAKAAGGIDHLSWAGTWQATEVYDGTYSDICDDASNQGFMFGIADTANAQQQSIGAAKQKNEGVALKCTGTVTAALNGYFYLEATDRSSGIRVAKSDFIPALGNTVTASGFMSITPGGERMLMADRILQDDPGDLLKPILPMMLTLKNVGGGNLGNPAIYQGQRGVESGFGLNNVGLLVTVTGYFIPPVSPTYFHLDDGSGVLCRIVDNGDFIDAGEGDYVSVTGIVSLFVDDEGKEQRMIIYQSGQVLQ